MSDVTVQLTVSSTTPEKGATVTLTCEVNGGNPFDLEDFMSITKISLRFRCPCHIIFDVSSNIKIHLLTSFSSLGRKPHSVKLTKDGSALATNSDSGFCVDKDQDKFTLICKHTINNFGKNNLSHLTN